MMLLVLLLTGSAVVSNAKGVPQIVCGYLPSQLYSCIGGPQIVTPDRARQCSKDSVTECDSLTCVFNKAGWLKDGKLNKPKLSQYIDEYGKDHPEWQSALAQVKTTCIANDLPAQGIYLNCPAYDVTECIFATFIKNAPRSQWSSKSECEAPRLFAGACPICPNDCFSAQIPINSCNACLSLPH